MRNLNLLDIYRDTSEHVMKRYGSIGDEETGVFLVPSNLDGAFMRVIAYSGDGWDHVSVSRQTRCPYWEEMEQVKRMFFQKHETAMQLHVAEDDYINRHPYCLHLWRPHKTDIPRPPKIMV